MNKFKKKRTYNELVMESKQSTLLERKLGDKIKDNDVDDEEERKKLDEINSNGIVIANFTSYNDLKRYITDFKPCINYITFGKTNINIDDSIIERLNIISKNDFNNLIQKFWKINDSEMLNSLKKCNFNNSPKLFSYESGKYKDRNNDMTNVLQMLNSTDNRNELNSIRNMNRNDGLKKKLEIEYSEKQKQNYLSNIIFKKYIMLFYDIETERLDSIRDLFTYNYFMEALKNKKNKKHKEIIDEANKFLKKDNETLKKNKSYTYCVYLYNSLVKMFNYTNFKYKNIIEGIKNLFKDDPKFYYSVSPVNIFQRDLLDLKVNIDYNNTCYFYEQNLPYEIKVKYEIKYYICKLIKDYKESLRNKIKKLKKEEEENEKKYGNTEEIRKKFRAKPKLLEINEVYPVIVNIPKEKIEKSKNKRNNKKEKKEKEKKNEKDKNKKKDKNESNSVDSKKGKEKKKSRTNNKTDAIKKRSKTTDSD